MCLVYSIRTWPKVWIGVFLWKNKKNEIDERASVPNFENLNTCSCRSNCIREEAETFARAEVKAKLFKCLPRWKFAMPE